MKYLTLLAGAVAIASAPIHADNLFVANRDNDSVTVVSTLTQTEVAVIDTLNAPLTIFATPDGNQAWVLPQPNAGGSAQVIDTQNYTILATVNASGGGLFRDVVFSPDSSLAYLLNDGADVIQVFNTANFTEGTAIPSPVTNPQNFAITPDGTTLYVTTNSVTMLGKVTGVNTPTPASTTFNLPGTADPLSIAITPDGTKIYLPNNESDFYFANLPITSDADISTFTLAINTANDVPPLFTQDSSSFYIPGAGGVGFSQVATADNSLIQGDFGADGQAYTTFGSTGRFIYSTQDTSNIFILDTTTNTGAGSIATNVSSFGLVAIEEPFTIFTAQSLRNRSILQYELYNRVTWTVPFPISWTPQLYLIYRDAALTDLAFAEPASTGNRVFNDQGRTRGVTYEYYLVAVDTNDITHILGMTSVTSQ